MKVTRPFINSAFSICENRCSAAPSLVHNFAHSFGGRQKNCPVGSLQERHDQPCADGSQATKDGASTTS